MLKTEEEKKIQELARAFSKKDKRLSWDTCLKKAKQQLRRFNGGGGGLISASS